MIVGEAFIKIGSKTASFEPELKKGVEKAVEKTAKETATKFGSIFSAVAGAQIVLGTARRAASFLKDSIKDFEESERATLKLDAAFEKFPLLADSSVKGFTALAKSLQQTTRFSDESTKAAEANLAVFNLTGRQIQQLIPLAADFAARTGRDLPEASIVLGRALLGFARPLKQVGINFKDTGSLAGNFDELMTQLSLKVGGFAQKEGTLLGGRLAILGNQFKDIKENIGQAVVPVLLKLSGATLGVIHFFQSLPGPVDVAIASLLGLGAGLVVVSKLGAAFRALAASEVFATLAAKVGTLTTGLELLATGNFALVFSSLASAVSTLVPGLVIAGGEAGALGVSLGGVTAAGTGLVTSLGGVALAIGSVIAGAKLGSFAFDSLVNPATRAGGAFDRFADTLQRSVSFIPGAAEIIRGLEDKFPRAQVVERFGEAVEEAKKHGENFFVNLKKLSDQGGNLKAVLGGIADGSFHAGLASVTSADAANKQSGAFENLTGASFGAATAVNLVAQASADAQAVLSRLTSAGTAFDQRLESFTPKFGDLIAGQADKAQKASTVAGHAADQLARAEQDAARSIADAQRQIADAHKQAAQSVGDAELRLARTTQESRLRIRDAVQALAQTELEATRQREDAQANLSRVEEALFGKRHRTAEEDRQLAEARKAFQRTQDDTTAKQASAEQNLADARRQAAQQQIDAQKELVRAQQEAAKRIADATRGLADAQRQAARSIADAQSSAISGAQKLAAVQQLSVNSLAASFKKNTSDLNSFVGSLTTIFSKVSQVADKDLVQPFLAKLSELGPGAAPFLAKLAALSDKELGKLAGSFGKQIAAAKAAADLQFDKFPPNFRDKLRAANDVAVRELDVLIRTFDKLKPGPIADEAAAQIAALGRQISQEAQAGIIALTPQQQKFIDVADAAEAAGPKIAALKSLIESIHGTRVVLTVDARPARREVDALIVLLSKLAKPLTPITIAHAVREFQDQGGLSGAAEGGPIRAGQSVFTGEKGIEVFSTRFAGGIATNKQVIQAINDIISGRAGSNTVINQNTTNNVAVTEVAQDPRATARSVATRLGGDSIR